ncbi:MAG: HAMP domain-containing sensor histidine kinase, partial [Deltaproteobacteria bacterium]|nr:HAMP domain-containing sensor histidine kinase [Deltaproteobacteria bacterium]
ASGLEMAAKQERMVAEERVLFKTTAKVIHDLRSPLDSLQIASECLSSKTFDNPQEKQAFDLLQMATQRLKDIAEELLTKKKKAETKIQFSIHKALADLLLELESKINSKELTVKKEFAPKDFTFWGDQTEFKRAINNILTNAVEAMNGRGILTIKTELTDNNGIIRITDTGGGMPAPILEKIMKGGFSYNKTNGNGIGMTVVREFVEKHNGKLNAQSDVGKGTLFEFQLPLDADQTNFPAT